MESVEPQAEERRNDDKELNEKFLALVDSGHINFSKFVKLGKKSGNRDSPRSFLVQFKTPQDVSHFVQNLKKRN